MRASFLDMKAEELLEEIKKLVSPMEGSLETENQHGKEQGPRVKTKEEVIESLEKESSELNDRLHRLVCFLVTKDKTEKVKNGHLSLMELQRISMILYSKVLELRIEDLKR